MKVILSQDIAGLGKKWDVKEVKRGYGRNFLLLRNLAVLATKKSIDNAKIRQEQELQEKSLKEDLLKKTLDSFKNSIILLERKANEKGHLFDGVDTRELAEIINEKFKIKIPVDYIKLEKPLKETGVHQVIIKSGGYEALLQVEIKAKE